MPELISGSDADVAVKAMLGMGKQRLVEIFPAWDKRDPDPNKNHGIHCCELRMVLIGKSGAVQFVLYTGWYPEGTITNDHPLRNPLPADLGYHSPRPMFIGQEPREDCPYLNGKPCYYDGSGLNAQRVYHVLLGGGSDAVWRELEEYYNQTFSE